MNKFEEFMFVTENIQDNIADIISVRKIENKIIKSEDFEYGEAAMRRMIQRAKEIFDEKNIIYPEGY